MTPIFEKATKGNKKALFQLYDDYKMKVFGVSYFLSGDMETAEKATSYAFTNTLNGVLSEIKSEEDFLLISIQKACDFCKRKITSKNNKAFRFPANRNFSISHPEAFEKTTDNDILNILNGFPSLQRFIFVLHTNGLSSDKISKILTTDYKTIELAFGVEEENVQKILKSQNSNLSFEKLKSALLSEEMEFPKSIDNAINKSISEISKPMENEAKSKKEFVFTTVAVFCIVAVIAAVIIALLPRVTSTFTTEGNQGASDTTDNVLREPPRALFDSPEYYANINVKDYGTIKLKLEPEYAPITVSNFVDLVENDFYNGLTFHRIMEGFMMQGGDPNGNGTGGSSRNIFGEFSANGHENNLSHTAGVISMARSSDYNSGSSQFFIVHQDSSSSLDGQYAAFGRVVEGMDIVDKICKDSEPTDDNGTIPKDYQPIITSIDMEYVKIEENTSENASESTGENASESTGENASESTGENASESTGENASESTGENASENTSQAIA